MILLSPSRGEKVLEPKTWQRVQAELDNKRNSKIGGREEGEKRRAALEGSHTAPACQHIYTVIYSLLQILTKGIKTNLKVYNMLCN